MSRRNEFGKSKTTALTVFVVGMIFCTVAVVLTIAGIWESGHGGQLGGTAAVFYALGAVFGLSGGHSYFDWDWS